MNRRNLAKLGFKLSLIPWLTILLLLILQPGWGTPLGGLVDSLVIFSIITIPFALGFSIAGLKRKTSRGFAIAGLAISATTLCIALSLLLAVLSACS